MKEAVIREKLMEISEAISSLKAAVSSSGDSGEGLYIPQSNVPLEDVIDNLRMQMKYLMFDLEASRRENRYLRQMLEMRPPHSRGSQ